MDCTLMYAKMADVPELQEIAFKGNRYKINGYSAEEKIRFQNGDLLFERESGKVYVIYLDKNYSITPEEVITVTNAKPDWDETKVVWMPRRADLQAIYHLKQPKGYSHYQVLTDLGTWVQKNDYLYSGSHITQGFSMEKLWLLFVMSEVFGKEFDALRKKWN